MKKSKIIIMGAAGRDFHNFNVCFRENADYKVAAFTATQIPHIEERKYPAELAGDLYPDGIPIFPESRLEELIKKHHVDQVVFAYSDVDHDYVMRRSALVNGAGADFVLLGGHKTMLPAKVPVIAVCATRTGCGKSQTTRKVCELLQKKGRRVVAIRHPMPYGDLAKQKVQRFASYADLNKHECTIEEREEYEPHIDRGNIIYAGVDYGAILEQAQEEADIILWDGGNNDTPFYKPDLWITVADPHRAGHEIRYYPGVTNFRMADVVVINKLDTADQADVNVIRENINTMNPGATVVDAASPVYLKNANLVRGKRVLVVEDGPTLTHGGMRFGAGVVAARKYGAAGIVDPRPWITGEIRETFQKYPDIGPLLPAMGYGLKQIEDLQKTIEKVECDTVIIGTPIDLSRIIKFTKPTVRIEYRLQEIGEPTLEQILAQFEYDYPS